MATWHLGFVHLWVATLEETYGTHTNSITTLWTAWRLLSIYPSSDRQQTDLKDCPESCITAATCWNPGQKTIYCVDQMRLKTASDDGAKLYYIKGIFYSIMFHVLQRRDELLVLIFTQRPMVTRINIANRIACRIYGKCSFKFKSFENIILSFSFMQSAHTPYCRVHWLF